MLLEKRIISFARLGAVLREAGAGNEEPRLAVAIKQAHIHNGWFTEENIRIALSSLGEMLRESKLRDWISKYPQLTSQKPEGKKVGVIMAGNIPLVGFHDFLCVLMSGNTFEGKLASDDAFLLPATAKILCGLEPEFEERIHFTDKPFNNSANISAFIATGSNNSARYFEYYFSKYPHIIRKNRNAIAILNGKETAADLRNLGKDIFQYFGMGCRNVSKIYIPKDYELDHFFKSIVDFGDVINHNKYYNNHQYYHTIYLLNNEKFLDNNFLMLKESKQIASPVAALHYERYNNQTDLLKKLHDVRDQIQCVVSDDAIPSPWKKIRVKPGEAQSPELWDYADGVDTMQFLLSL